MPQCEEDRAALLECLRRLLAFQEPDSRTDQLNDYRLREEHEREWECARALVKRMEGKSCS